MNKILFIDDEVEILSSYRKFFEVSPKGSDLEGLASDFFGETSEQVGKSQGAEFSVSTASQGQEGIDLVKENLKSENPFRVAFIDMRMPPGIGGLETAKKIRQLDPQIELVIVTAYSDTDLSQIVDEIGTPDKLLYLKKPFDIQEIKQLAFNLSVKHRNESIKDDFISNVSHELKTPLASILGFYQLLNELPELSMEAKEYLGFLGSSAKLMKNLIDELLVSLEFKREGIKLDINSTQMKPFISRCYQTLLPLFKEKEGVQFILDIDKNCDDSICEIDHIRINQCVNNLVSNAIKFTEKGAISLGLSKKDDWVCISVGDTGYGIDSSKLEIIFDKFSRTENTHHQIPGLGLGLSIVKNIVDAHQGKVLVESQLGRGSHFVLKFKAKESR